jgi:hypothetical protein
MPIATGSAALAQDVLNLMTIVRKTADETVNNSAVLQNDDDLLLPIGANEIWRFEFVIYGISNATADFKYSLVGPAASNVRWEFTGENESATVVSWNFLAGGVAVAARGFADGSHTLNILRGVIINGANAGNLQLQWAQNTADASDTKVFANSCLLATRLA